MSKPDLSDEELKAEIMYRLDRKGCWGARYLPVNAVINWLSKKISRDGKRLRRAIDQLVRDRYILLHKKGEMMPLNPTQSREISDYVERNMPH